MAGTVNPDDVINSIPQELFVEWWAYAVLSGWFPEQRDKAAGEMMTPEESARYLESGRWNGQYNHTYSRL